MTNIYKIIFNKSSNNLCDDYEKLSDYEKDIISELNTESFFDYEESSFYTCFIITTSLELDRYLKILKNNLIKYECLNLSKSILTNQINLELLEEKLDSQNYYKYDFFMDDLDNWIYQNLHINLVLDRISEVGIDKLKDVEKEFLKNYKI